MIVFVLFLFLVWNTSLLFDLSQAIPVNIQELEIQMTVYDELALFSASVLGRCKFHLGKLFCKSGASAFWEGWIMLESENIRDNGELRVELSLLSDT